MEERESVPVWRLREGLRRRANEIIRGRAGFEQHVGRPSEKPLPSVDVDPRDLLRLLDALDECEHFKEQYHEEWMIAAGNRPGGGGG